MIEQREILEWSDPPRPANGVSGRAPGRPAYSEWERVAFKLRMNPNQWALIQIGTAGSAHSLRTRIIQATNSAFRPAGTYQVTVRKTGKTYRVWARYVTTEEKT